MSVRNDITIDITSSPRIIEVASPSQALTLQDLGDTLRAWEDDPLYMEQPKIVDGFGKDDLGGGLEVRMTIVLLDAIVTFEARGGPGYDQCTIDGGNLTALDLNGLPVDPVTTNQFTQIVRTTSSSSVSEG